MDSKSCRESVNELSGSSRCEELGKGPFHSDVALDGISWLNSQDTSLCDVELKDVFDSDVPVLSAKALRNRSIISFTLRPLSVRDNILTTSIILGNAP